MAESTTCTGPEDTTYPPLHFVVTFAWLGGTQSQTSRRFDFGYMINISPFSPGSKKLCCSSSSSLLPPKLSLLVVVASLIFSHVADAVPNLYPFLGVAWLLLCQYLSRIISIHLPYLHFIYLYLIIRVFRHDFSLTLKY